MNAYLMIISDIFPPLSIQGKGVLIGKK